MTAGTRRDAVVRVRVDFGPGIAAALAPEIHKKIYYLSDDILDFSLVIDHGLVEGVDLQVRPAAATPALCEWVRTSITRAPVDLRRDERGDARDRRQRVVSRPRAPASRLRLVCFAHAGSGPPLFSGWARHLPEPVEVSAVTLPGRGRRHGEPALTRMADVLADAVRHVPGDVPFALFGHSLGALIAFELARALRRRPGPAPLHLLVSACPAPHVRRTAPQTHEWSDSRLLAELRRLGGTPGELLASTKFRDTLLRPYRADLAVYETYTYAAEAPLDCPIGVLGGLEDEAVTRADLEGWTLHTTAGCSLDLFPGGHFYLQRTDTAFLPALRRTLAGMLASLPAAVSTPPGATS